MSRRHQLVVHLSAGRGVDLEEVAEPPILPLVDGREHEDETEPVDRDKRPERGDDEHEPGSLPRRHRPRDQQDALDHDGGEQPWSDASGVHVRGISRSCLRYFSNNPYRQWFDVLDRMLVAGGASYYEALGMYRSCHIDLVAFATREKWGVLPGALRRSLVEQGRRTVAELLCDSPVQVLVLNGRSVVNAFEAFAQTSLTPSSVEDWTLPRSSGRGIRGWYTKALSPAWVG